VLEEKNEIAKYEKERREEITKKCEDFIKEIQQKYEKDLTEKEELIRENDMLRKNLQEYISNTSAIKENMEAQIKLKEQQTLSYENEFKQQVKERIDEIVKIIITIRVLAHKNTPQRTTN
jgi:hypothetical protein